MEPQLKKTMLIAASVGAGVVAMLAGLAGAGYWYLSRPKPPWNTTALLAKEPPGFSPSSDGRRIELRYSVENTTSRDYQIDSDAGIKIMLRFKDGSLSQLMSAEAATLELPTFIPAKQKAGLTLSLALLGIPEPETSESDDQYHERLRAYLSSRIGKVDGFVIFDETSRYEVSFPRWLSEPPKKNP